MGAGHGHKENHKGFHPALTVKRKPFGFAFHDLLDTTYRFVRTPANGVTYLAKQAALSHARQNKTIPV